MRIAKASLPEGEDITHIRVWTDSRELGILSFDSDNRLLPDKARLGQSTKRKMDMIPRGVVLLLLCYIKQNRVIGNFTYQGITIRFADRSLESPAKAKRA